LIAEKGLSLSVGIGAIFFIGIGGKQLMYGIEPTCEISPMVTPITPQALG